MRFKILDNIKNGLINNVGVKGEYNDLIIEDIQTRLPETVTVNAFIGISIDDTRSLNNEIGLNYPTNNEYLCSVVVLIKNANYEEGQNELEKIVRRVYKYFGKDTGELNGLIVSEDGVTENVISYNIDSINYTSGKLEQGALGHLAVFNILIKTNLIIN